MIDRGTRELMIEAAYKSFGGDAARHNFENTIDMVTQALDTAGYCIVPKEATRSMIEAACLFEIEVEGEEGDDPILLDALESALIWQAMVAKAQEGGATCSGKDLK